VSQPEERSLAGALEHAFRSFGPLIGGYLASLET
jgi:hypothetical protein